MYRLLVTFICYAFLSSIMVNFAQAVREHWVHILVPLGFVIGCYWDRKNDEKLTAFRNKSLLYRRSALGCLVCMQLFCKVLL